MLRLLRAVIAAVVLNVLCVNFDIVAEDNKISMEEVVKLALDTSPLVQSLEANYSFNQAESFEIQTLPNPELDVGYGAPTASEANHVKSEIEAAITQPIRLSHGPLRNRLADLMRTAGQRDKETEILELISKVRLAYSRAWVLSERERKLTDILPQARSLNQFVKSGVQEGAYGQGDEAIFRSETSKTEAELKGISAELILALSELTRLTGSAMQGKKLLPPQHSQAPSIEALKAKLENAETRVQARAKLLYQLAKADAEVARRDTFPELRPRLFYSRTEEEVDLVGVGISFDLPFYSQNTVEKIRKDAALRASESKLNFHQGEVFRNSILDLARAYALRNEEILLYERQVLPALQAALTSFEDQVRKGEGSIFQLWQTLREYLETHERYLELWTKIFSEGTELSILLEEEF